jgi:hypothetical protein
MLKAHDSPKSAKHWIRSSAIHTQNRKWVSPSSRILCPDVLGDGEGADLPVSIRCSCEHDLCLSSSQ